MVFAFENEPVMPGAGASVDRAVNRTQAPGRDRGEALAERGTGDRVRES